MARRIIKKYELLLADFTQETWKTSLLPCYMYISSRENDEINVTSQSNIEPYSLSITQLNKLVNK